MGTSHFKKTAVCSIVFLVMIALLLPLSGALAQDKPEAVGAPQEIKPGNMYVSKDALESDPVMKDIYEKYMEALPKNMVPDSLKEKPADKTKKASGASEVSGRGTGGWLPLSGAYTPSGDPNVSYEIGTTENENAVDQDGVQHTMFYEDTNTDIRQAPDPGPLAMNKELTDIYYNSYQNGTWSTPVKLVDTSGLEDCAAAMWEFDDNNYLHFVYTKWTWGRDSAVAGNNPPITNAYIHTNENMFYRYMAPDGTWSAPRQLTDLASGAWGITGGFFEVMNNRVYGTVLAQLNKQTSPASATNRMLCMKGYQDNWVGLHTIAAWDQVSAVGNEVAMVPPFFDVSRASGELTTIFTTRVIGADAFSSKCNIYGAVKSGAGSWSATNLLFTGANNEIWFFPMVSYMNSPTVCSCIGMKSIGGTDATHEPFENFVVMKHEASGWQPVVDLTRLPSKQVAGSASFFSDPMNRLHVVFSCSQLTWGGANWSVLGDSLHYTHETASGLADVQTILAMSANRGVYQLDAEMDVNGATHVVFPTYDLGTGGDYKIFYSDNTSGSWMTPKQLSFDAGQSIDEVALSVSPGIRSVCSWGESRLSGTGVPEIGVVCSMTCENGTWSDLKNIAAVPGSTDIVHVTGGWPTYASFQNGNQGDQICVFETSKYNTGTATYYDFNKYYCESLNGVWSAPELISDLDMSGYGYAWLDRNNIARAMWDVEDAATGKDVLYGTMQKAPTPSASTYYFAEGTTRNGFQEWLSLENAGTAEANVTITYMLGTGENKEQEVKVPAHSRVTVDVNGFVGPGQDVSASVVSDQLIVAERPMYFNYQGTIPGGDVAIGATSTSRVLYFAEGTTRPGFTEYLTLQNPSNTDTEVTITYMFGDGTTKEQKVGVGKKSRQTVDVNAFVGADKDVSVKIESPNVAIAAERPMYFNYHSVYQGGHDAVGSSGLDNRWYFAEGTTRYGFDTYLCLQNPGPVDAKATVTYIMGDGTTKDASIDLPATSRQTVNVNDIVGPEKDVSMVVDSSTLILAERPMYFNYHNTGVGGHNVVGGGSPKNAWYLAEGTTRTGFDEWLCLENASSENAIAAISYMLGDGSVVNKTQAVPAHTRVTVDVRLAVGNDKDVSTYIWCDKGIIVERPMYFNNGDRRWNGGSCVMGF